MRFAWLVMFVAACGDHGSTPPDPPDELTGTPLAGVVAPQLLVNVAAQPGQGAGSHSNGDVGTVSVELAYDGVPDTCLTLRESSTLDINGLVVGLTNAGGNTGECLLPSFTMFELPPQRQTTTVVVDDGETALGLTVDDFAIRPTIEIDGELVRGARGFAIATTSTEIESASLHYLSNAQLQTVPVTIEDDGRLGFDVPPIEGPIELMFVVKSPRISTCGDFASCRITLDAQVEVMTAIAPPQA